MSIERKMDKVKCDYCSSEVDFGDHGHWFYLKRQGGRDTKRHQDIWLEEHYCSPTCLMNAAISFGGVHNGSGGSCNI